MAKPERKYESSVHKVIDALYRVMQSSVANGNLDFFGLDGKDVAEAHAKLFPGDHLKFPIGSRVYAVPNAELTDTHPYKVIAARLCSSSRGPIEYVLTPWDADPSIADPESFIIRMPTEIWAMPQT